jgi:xanthine dehydrogenase YagT iron-sulfur-binding subunit
MSLPCCPVAVGADAPDVALSNPATRLASLRGAPTVVIISSSRWDPTRDEVTARLAAWHDLPDGVQVVHADGLDAASAFGTEGQDAAFVVDSDGVIRWRYVAGVDALPIVSGKPSPSSLDDSIGDGERSEWSRRGFIQAALTFAAALVVSRFAHSPDEAWAAEPTSHAATMPVTLRVNGRDVTLELEPRVTLLDALRNYAGLTGSKKGCDHGQCGACTVHIDGRRTLSCLTFAVMQQGREITTIEGLASGDTLSPIQQAFITCDGFQCGYCTSGQIMSASAMMKEPWGGTDADVKEAMSGNICRCGAYPGIVEAVQTVRGNRPGGAR